MTGFNAIKELVIKEEHELSDIDSIEWPEIGDVQYEIEQYDEEHDVDVYNSNITYVAIDFYSDYPMDSKMKIHSTYESALYDLYCRFEERYNLKISNTIDAETGLERNVFESGIDGKVVIACDGFFDILDTSTENHHYGYINQIIIDKKNRQSSYGLDTSIFEYWVGVVREYVTLIYNEHGFIDGIFNDVGYSDINALLILLEDCSKNGCTISEDIMMDYETGHKYMREELFKEY